MQYIKSPFNWVGNKYKFLDVINQLGIEGKHYECVYDMFMGSGNVILNLKCKSDKYIGNDKTKLIPKIFSEIKNYNTYTINDLEKILDNHNRISQKEDYYSFRDYWNTKYKNNEFDKDFIIETVLLLKMCSNSMVRFNQQGVFNQGFRGLGDKKEFFNDSMKLSCIEQLNELHKKIIHNNYDFAVSDFKEFQIHNNSLLILDPPYILRQDMYSQDFSKEHDLALLELISNTKNDFIYFNYIERNGEINKELNDVIKNNNFKVIEINNKSNSGQGRKTEGVDVKEVIVTNVQM